MKTVQLIALLLLVGLCLDSCSQPTSDSTSAANLGSSVVSGKSYRGYTGVHTVTYSVSAPALPPW